MTPRRLAILLALLGLGSTGAARTADLPKPVKVFILAGQSNMEGQAVADLDGKDYNDGKGTLKALLNDPAKAPLVKHLRTDKGEWTVRDDVWVRYQREKQPLLAGPLTIGFTSTATSTTSARSCSSATSSATTSPNQVLLIKTAWGGKSLYKDFRPPSSGGEVGPYYTKMIAEVREALANLKTDFPAYDGQGYELAGFVWYHGWNDGVDPKNAVPEYEQNLVNLIKDVRKELKAPNLPVVDRRTDRPVGERARRVGDAAEGAGRRGRAAGVQGQRAVRRDARLRPPGEGLAQPRPRAPRVRQRRDLLPGRRRTGQGDGQARSTPASRRRRPSRRNPRRTRSKTIEGWTVRVDDRLLQGARRRARHAAPCGFSKASWPTSRSWCRRTS